MSRCGTETGGTHLPHRQRPENDRAVLIHSSRFGKMAIILLFFKTVFIPHLRLEDLFCFSQFGSSSTALLGQVIAQSPHPSAGAGDRAHARCAPRGAGRSGSARGTALSPGMGDLWSPHWLGTTGAPVRL